MAMVSIVTLLTWGLAHEASVSIKIFASGKKKQSAFAHTGGNNTKSNV